MAYYDEIERDRERLANRVDELEQCMRTIRDAMSVTTWYHMIQDHPELEKWFDIAEAGKGPSREQLVTALKDLVIDVEAKNAGDLSGNVDVSEAISVLTQLNAYE